MSRSLSQAQARPSFLSFSLPFLTAFIVLLVRDDYVIVIIVSAYELVYRASPVQRVFTLRLPSSYRLFVHFFPL